LECSRKVVQQVPIPVDYALALTRYAVQFNDISNAERPLASVDESSRNTAAYHQASALVAQLKQEYEKAEAEWTEALRQKPEDKSFQLQLGVLRLRANDPERRGSGEAMLSALRSDTSQRSAATRALLKAAVARRDDPRKL